MASANCWKCLLRPSSGLPVARLAAPTPIIAFTTAPFSTSAMLSAKGPPKKLAAKDSAKGHIRAGKRMRLGKFKKKKEVDRGKPPGPGERKAFRKRIQLSNNNALAVPDLQPLTKEAMADRQAAGAVLAVPDAVVDQLRTLDAFKPTQCWGLFRQPSVLLRSETVDLVQKMQQAAGNKEALRLVVTGDRISGKSMLMLQAMANGLLNDWVVINIPEAQELTTASTEYSPLPNSNPVQYLQPVYTFKLLQAIRNANEKVLSSLKTVNEHPNLQMHVPSGSSLFALASAAREADQAWAVFQALWAELTEKDAGRPPVMVALDGLAHIMKVSDYRNAAFEPIHSHDLALVRMYVDLLTGATKLPNGGAVLAATSRGNSPTTASMELALARRQAAQQGKEVPPADPYFKGYDERVEAALSNVEVMGLRGVNKAEARSLMEYWAASGLLRAKVDEKAVTGTWSVSGNGVVGEMERAALLNMRL